MSSSYSAFAFPPSGYEAAFFAERNADGVERGTLFSGSPPLMEELFPPTRDGSPCPPRFEVIPSGPTGSPEATFPSWFPTSDSRFEEGVADLPPPSFTGATAPPYEWVGTPRRRVGPVEPPLRATDTSSGGPLTVGDPPASANMATIQAGVVGGFLLSCQQMLVELDRGSVQQEVLDLIVLRGAALTESARPSHIVDQAGGRSPVSQAVFYPAAFDLSGEGSELWTESLRARVKAFNMALIEHRAASTPLPAHYRVECSRLRKSTGAYRLHRERGRYHKRTGLRSSERGADAYAAT
jgi:hypothetical protein